MVKRNLKRAYIKELEMDFVKKFRAVLAPTKGAIRNHIDKGMTAHQAVDEVFRDHNIRGHLKHLVLEAMVQAAKRG